MTFQTCCVILKLRFCYNLLEHIFCVVFNPWSFNNSKICLVFCKFCYLIERTPLIWVFWQKLLIDQYVSKRPTWKVLGTQSLIALDIHFQFGIIGNSSFMVKILKCKIHSWHHSCIFTWHTITNCLRHSFTIFNLG